MKIIREIIRFTYKFIREYRFKIMWYLAAGTVLYLITSVIPLIVGAFIDAFAGNVEITNVLTLCLVFLGLSILQVILCYYVKVEGTRICSGASNKMKADFFLHMQKVSPLKNKIDDPAALADRVNNECEYLIMFLCNLGMQFPGKCVGTAIIFAYIVLKSWPLAIVVLLVIPVLIYFHKKTRDVIYETSFECEKARNHFFSIMYEQLGQMRLIRTHGIFEFMHKRILNAGNTLLEANVRQEKKTFKYSLFSQNTDIFLKLFLFVFGGIFLIKGKISIGTFTVLYTYLGILSDDLSYFINVSQEAYQYKAFLDRLKEIDAEEEEAFGKEKVDKIDLIEIKNMSFGYAAGNKLFDNYCNIFEKGKLYCLVGGNGAGKSTLIKNILGLFVDATGKNVSYNGKNLCDMDIYDARKRLIGVCEQEPDMLDDTLYNNLLYCEDENIDMERFKDICESLDLFQDMHCGMDFNDMMKKNALELSGGQKQKFALARAIYKNPSVLILDEPSSALDKSGVIRLKEQLTKLKADKIIIMISHDAGLIELADEIVKPAQQFKRIWG